MNSNKQKTAQQLLALWATETWRSFFSEMPLRQAHVPSVPDELREPEFTAIQRASP